MNEKQDLSAGDSAKIYVCAVEYATGSSTGGAAHAAARDKRPQRTLFYYPTPLLHALNLCLLLASLPFFVHTPYKQVQYDIVVDQLRAVSSDAS